MALTRSQLMRIKENRKYWRDREAKQREAYIRTDNEELTEINRVYDEMYRWAEREINAFYGKYATAEGIDITEAKRRVSNLDIAEYEKLAKEYVKDKDFSPQANAEMRLYNATMKINRLELLKAQIGLKLVDGINDIDKHWEKIATDRATQEIIRQSGILGKTLTDTETARTAKQIVNADFYNATFSQRIWSHMDNLKSDLSIELQKGFIAGVSSREMARRLKEHAFDKSERDAFRLARTELRRIQTDVAKDNYERNGIEQYVYMAVNPNACDICKAMDGTWDGGEAKVYDVKKMRAGLNAPPMHPNCHCTTAPYIDDNEYEQWLTWLERGGTTEQWDEMSPAKRQNWYDKIVKSTPKITTPTVAPTVAPTKNGDNIAMINSLQRSGVQSKPIKDHPQPLPEKDIIKRLAGGDKTGGSCASVALAYIGQKSGWDVLDFRGGNSRDWFARRSMKIDMLNWQGVEGNVARGKNDVTSCHNLFKGMEEGKEYMLCTGGHGAMVKKTPNGMQYLELQHPIDSENGWHDLDDMTLRNRFGCKIRRKYEVPNVIIKSESIEGNGDFKELLEYLNTEDSAQKKGSSGYVR